MKISVIIVTHNRLNELHLIIKNFLNQTYDDKEIIVIDNASNDGTKEIIPAQYPKIKYLWLPENFDIRSINIGIEMSNGDIIWRTDSDSHPESLESFDKVVEIFKNNPNVDIIAMEDIEVKSNYQVWNWYPLKIDKEKIPYDGYKAHTFHGTGAAIRRSVFDRIGGFWEFGFEELDFCTRAILAGFNIRYFPNIRILHYSVAGNTDKEDRWLKNSNQMLRYNAKYYPFFRAFARGIFLYFFQLFVGLLRGVKISAIIEAMYSMPAVSIHAYRCERIKVPKNKYYDITLGTSIVKAQMIFLKHSIISKTKKFRMK